MSLAVVFSINCISLFIIYVFKSKQNDDDDEMMVKFAKIIIIIIIIKSERHDNIIV